MAVYSQDPHLNWGRAHLLHQGPLLPTTTHLVFPLLQCQPTIYLSDPKRAAVLGAEETLILLKPNIALRTDITSSITNDLANLGLSIVWTRPLKLAVEQVAEFYAEHRGKSFFPDLLDYLAMQPTLALVITGLDAIKQVRTLVGPTDPDVARTSAPDSLRARYGISKTYNSVHASDSYESAVREIGLFCSF